MIFFNKKTRRRNPNREIDPDEIFLDSANLPKFDQSQFEGRLEKPITQKTVIVCAVVFLFIFFLFTAKVLMLQVKNGGFYAEKSAKNSLRQSVIFPDRGVIYDRNNVILASNVYVGTSSEYSKRVYNKMPGIAHMIGYIRYPAKDANGFYYQADYEGVDGAEKIYDKELAGKIGLKIIETNALGAIQSESILELPQDGTNVILSADSRIQEKLYDIIKTTAGSIGFAGGAGVILDINTGEALTSVSFPEYDSNVMSDKTNAKEISAFVTNKQNPFLNRVTDGLYTPGSIVKPFIALAALQEKVIGPKTQILSTGSISIPNPFDPTKKSVFNDWRPQGLVDMAHALAVSSDVYFYEIGGGFEKQPGLGIANIEKYMRMFGFGEAVPDNSLLDKDGTIPSPLWKSQNFKGDQWRIGDTYNTSIGQYGFQVTLMQMVRAVASIANGGKLLNPTILRTTEKEASAESFTLPFSKDQFDVVKEGMRLAVTEGTAKGLDIPQVALGAKTGTAELGTVKKFVNSWVVGFFPYDNPRFAFVGLMEKGPYSNTIGALYVFRQLFEWMAVNTPEYLR